VKTRWRLLSTDLVEREKDYTATFVMLNVDSDAQVTVALTTAKGPASDLIGACRATAVLLLTSAGGTDADATIEKLN
jgi:hypothetical protein